MSQHILGDVSGITPLHERSSPGALPTTSNFSSYMHKASPAPTSTLQSPMELAQGGIRANPATANAQGVLAQIELMQGAMQTMQGQLATPQLKMSPSQKYLLRNKFLSANSSLQAVQERMGSQDQESKEQEEDSSSPVTQFLRYLTDGMQQLDAAKAQLANLKDKASDLTPMDFLFIQLQLAKAQQEIEFTSIMLSKMVDGFKMIMNIQL